MPGDLAIPREQNWEPGLHAGGFGNPPGADVGTVPSSSAERRFL